MRTPLFLARLLPLLLVGSAFAAPSALAPAPVVALNQVGFLTGQPKRFTAPLSPDGTAFTVRRADDAAPLFTGRIAGRIGDFTAFQPKDSAVRYVVALAAAGDQPAVTSDPFLISPKLWQEQFWQPAVDFMVDIRCVTGTHPSAYGGGAYRDSTYYSFEAPSLILLHQAAPEIVDAMPRQIDWAADKARVLAPDFPFDPKNPESDGTLEAARRYYTDLAPPAAAAPDVVKLIHWSLGYILMRPASRDPSEHHEPQRRIHGQHVEQFAYLFAHWPQLARWLPESFRAQCHAFAFANWESSGLLAIDPNWDPAIYDPSPKPGDELVGKATLRPFKGRYPPGHSIVPNLLMHELAGREKRADAPRVAPTHRRDTRGEIQRARVV
jgi:hypothetical protein